MLGTSEIFGNVSHFRGNTLVFFLSEFGFFSSRGYDTGVGCSHTVSDLYLSEPNPDLKFQNATSGT